jgi:hypothetical protein
MFLYGLIVQYYCEYLRIDTILPNVMLIAKLSYDYLWRLNKTEKLSQNLANGRAMYAMSYQYAANDPIKNIDVNGDSIWVTTTVEDIKNSKGRVIGHNVSHVVHVTGKVLDLAGIGSASLENYVSELNRVGNGLGKFIDLNTGERVSIKFDFDFCIAKSMGDVSPSDHLIAIVDNVEGKADPNLGGGDAGGLAERNGKIAYIENDSESNWLVSTSIHELGHNFGLDHERNGSGNWMSYDKNPSKYEPWQLLQIVDDAKKGRLNQGQNYERSIKSTNNWFWHTSTNTAPYYKNTIAGERIPKTIQND